MNRNEQTSQPKTPLWAWAFMAACATIPAVSLGGAIPGAIGAVGAVTCYGLARDGKGGVGRRILSCAIVTLMAWGAFGALVIAVKGGSDDRVHVVQSSDSGTKTSRTIYKDGEVVFHEETTGKRDKSFDELNEDERREIYSKAIERRTDIEDKRDQIEDRLGSGRSTRVLEKQLATLEKMHENHLDFVASWNKLTRSELEAIIGEGDDEGWDWDWD